MSRKVIALPRAPDPPKVLTAIAGNHKLTTNEARSKLGPVAWQIWTYLIHARDKAGWSHARRATIAKARNLSARQVIRGLARLKLAGLVEEVGWRESNRQGAKSRSRRVLGDYRRGGVTIPLRCWRSFNALPTRGGKRSGAGRPSLIKDEACKTQNASLVLDQGGCDLADEKHPGPVFKADRTTIKADRTRIQSGSNSTFSSGDSASNIEDLRAKIEPLIDLSRGSVEILSEDKISTGAARPPRLDLSRRGAEENEAVPMNEDHIDALAKMYAEGGGIIPRFPTTSMMAVVQLPSPPLIPVDLADVDAVHMAIKAYRGAVEAHFKEPSFVFARTDITLSKYYPSMLEAVRIMRDFEIAPAAWCSFSMAVWRSYAKGAARNRPPPISFVLSRSRIEEKHGWFRAEESSHGGGRLLFAAEHKEVLQRWSAVERMRRRVLADLEKKHGGVIPLDEARSALAALVEEWFPGGYQSWIDRAKEKGEHQRRQLAELISQGEYVWGT